jgi:hypothetical protein
MHQPPVAIALLQVSLGSRDVRRVGARGVWGTIPTCLLTPPVTRR